MKGFGTSPIMELMKLLKELQDGGDEAKLQAKIDELLKKLQKEQK